ncbi:MAG: glutaredoxin family protein [Methanosarcinaceae archaeon]|nr:glutaredoxin family protein [Methanosarcinaceae archaeon]MDD4331051.1 glutaredoxin family protein [Methanosarcinaceae archaeon]
MDLFHLKKEKRSHIEGTYKGDIIVYGLSTCVWCKKTKKLLSELGVEFDFVYVDRLKGAEEKEVLEEVKKYNPLLSFPTTVIEGKTVIVGFKEKQLRESLGFLGF